jgi:hypothetical protein
VVKKQISINVQSGYGQLNMTLTQDIQHIDFKVYNDFPQSFKKCWINKHNSLHIIYDSSLYAPDSKLYDLGCQCSTLQ